MEQSVKLIRQPVDFPYLHPAGGTAPLPASKACFHARSPPDAACLTDVETVPEMEIEMLKLLGWFLF
jgi:hypothetical protein